MATAAVRDLRPAESGRTAIIDIGSNSIRLVVYAGPARVPQTLFNEKVMAGLGRDLATTGAIAPDGMQRAVAALERFAALARAMDVTDLRTVATAAVRDAANGHELIDAAAKMGIAVRLLSGEEEAAASGYGVLSGIPDADGIVGDLGGGSLELVRIVAGTVTDRISFPLGVLRLAAIRAKGKDALRQDVARRLRKGGWQGRGRGLPFYLVGGSWRALARLDMETRDYPLPVLQQYALTPADVARLGRQLARSDRQQLRSIPGLSSSRIPTLGDAAALLAAVLKELGSDRAVASTFGLREGLLYSALDPDARDADPLIVAARDEGERQGRFPEHGDLLERWIAPLFADDAADLARLRHVSCLLADVGWHANPEFRADRSREMALHGTWVAIDARGRALIAQALHSNFAGSGESPPPLPRLADAETLARAAAWGLAIRLGQRLSGGVAAPLKRSRLMLEPDVVTLVLADADLALYGEVVERRHKALAQALGRTSRLSCS